MTGSEQLIDDGFFGELDEEVEQVRMPTVRKKAIHLGRVVQTSAALDVLTVEEATNGLKRHIMGDWGDVCDEDKQANEEAREHGGQLMSVYTSQGGVKFWVITEHDRSATTILLPEDY